MTQIPDKVIHLIQILNKSKYEGYLVGGCVRDLVLSKIKEVDIIPHDYDLCTNAKPEEIEELLKRNHISYHTIGKEFGTITAILNGEEYEITTYRKETGYSDNRHPDKIEFTNEIEEDLCRRDFTINAMAYNPITDEFIDPYHGYEDLEKGYIECVGNPYDRFQEDGLRVLRALRFAITKGFKISPRTYDVMLDEKSIEALTTISKERVTDEFRKILTSGKPISYYFNRLHPIIFACIPEFAPCFGFKQNNKYHLHHVYDHCLAVCDNCNSNKFEIKLAALLHDIGKPNSYALDEEGKGHFYGHPEVGYRMCQSILKDDFRLTTDEYNEISLLIQNHDVMIASTKPSVKRLLNKFDEGFVRDLVILKQADIDDHIFPNPEKINNKSWMDKDFVLTTIDKIKEEDSCFSLKDLDINGRDLIALGFKGKEIGIMLDNILNRVIDERLTNEKKYLINYAKIHKNYVGFFEICNQYQNYLNDTNPLTFEQYLNIDKIDYPDEEDNNIELD